MLRGKCFQATVLHKVTEIMQIQVVAGKVIVVTNAPDFCTVCGHYFKVCQMQQSISVAWREFPVFQVDNTMGKRNFSILSFMGTVRSTLLLRVLTLRPAFVFFTLLSLRTRMS